MPARGEQVALQGRGVRFRFRQFAEGVARHEFSGNAGNPRIARSGEPEIDRAGLFGATGLAQHAGFAHQRTGPNAGIRRIRKPSVPVHRAGGQKLLKFESLTFGESVCELVGLSRGRRAVEQAVGGQRGKSVAGDDEQQSFFGLPIRGRRDEPGTEAFAGFGKSATRNGGDAVGSLFEPILRPLRFDDTLLIEQSPAKPRQRRNRNKRNEKQKQKQAARRFEPLSRWRHDTADCTLRSARILSRFCHDSVTSAE